MPPTPTANGDHQRPRPPSNDNHHRTRPPPNDNHHRIRPPPINDNNNNNHQRSRSTQNDNNHQFYYPTTPYSSSSSSSASFRGCCCCLFLLFSFLALLVLAVVLVVFLAVKPKKPQFDLQQVGVQYMGITAPNPSQTATTTTDPNLNPNPNPTTTASLSLSIRMLFTAVNPNKVGIKYGESRFTVMYRGIPLGKASVPGFYQEAHSTRQVVATIAVDRVNLLQADAVDLIKDASLNDRVELRVLGDVGAKIRVLNFDSPGVQVSVDCAIVISPRKQSLTYKQCGFDGVNV
ncbi:hypothetical protein CsatB_015175 [Cannabis sativa]|uniref:Late embryogenesis abundant protein LEA-2 subgroup domain-containing protein n=1 Tax=Cannabis sativa TaxID=3483 RepID=A0A7J6FIY3_CANSA|nr:uncharacterized protein LOC115725464 [Cannabis sativa]KAF4369720.1 hypothetical protein G4B88_022118 [Cannabis sativa]KAF4376252.1 hypothetical protein F8388_018921 [Cannabis sativa]KAF4384239.1 hypothetical protein G4B88_016805 [Cannabis sativa]KAF4384947.1 hypothetical protein F8388_010545 [Cannabis sativa]